MRQRPLILTLIFIICMLTCTVGTSYLVSADSSLQQEYTKRYKKLNKKCKKKYTYDAPQLEMNQNSYEEYELWDAELNYIYNDIFQRLDENQQSKLIKSELKWIERRDQKAEYDAEGWEGGSGYPMVYNLSLVKSTKKRIRWLIKNYA